MKIAILSLRSRFGDVTGDCVQAEKTAKALKKLRQDAMRYYLEPHSGKIYDESNIELGDWQDVMGGMDIIHTIPPIPIAHILRQPKVKAKLVTSSVFWSSPTYLRVEFKNGRAVDLDFIKALIREVAVALGIKLLRAKEGYDLLLPNSEDEIRCVKKYCRLKHGAKLVAVPNAIDCISERLLGIGRVEGVPKEDYVLIPGYFAPRKNQLMAIEALRNSDYQIVFIGQGPLLARCKKKATGFKQMNFLGHVEHGSALFYSLMKHARVICLPSNCETPGIAGLEGAAFGARPVVPFEGGTTQYYGWDAEYHNPLSMESLRIAVDTAWQRGRLTSQEALRYRTLTWDVCAAKTLRAYSQVL